DVVADLAFENDPPLGRSNVEVSLVVWIVRRQILLVPPDRLCPHMVVLHHVLPVELRIFFRLEQVEVRSVVARVRAWRDVQPNLHDREAGHWSWPWLA